jgi:hypothetical protein
MNAAEIHRRGVLPMGCNETSAHTFGMVTLALREVLGKRYRSIAVIASCGLAIAALLVVAAISDGFEKESERTVHLARANGWIVAASGTGPFLQPTVLTDGEIGSVVSALGDDHAAPVVVSRQRVRDADDVPLHGSSYVNLIGAIPNRLGSPMVEKGRALSNANEAVVDSSLLRTIGQIIRIGGHRFTVVGLVSGARLWAGDPNVYVTLRDAQMISFGGQTLAHAIVIDRPLVAPVGTKLLTNHESIVDGLRGITSLRKSMNNTILALWLVLFLLLTAALFLSVLDRATAFSVLKGTGVSSSVLSLSLFMQSQLLALVSVFVGALTAFVVLRLFALHGELSFRGILGCLGFAIAVASFSCLLSFRKLTVLRPILAFDH